MNQGYLARESERVNKATRKTFARLLIVFLCGIALIYVLGKDSIDFSDISYGSVSFYFIILAGLMLAASVIKLIAAGRVAKNGSNLYLPFQENTKEAVARIIDQEAEDGKILLDEYIYAFTDPKKAYGEKIVLTPSYLLLCGIKGGPKGTSKVTAIPLGKICWVCAQVGYKGGPFIVRLLIFTEKKIYHLTGVDKQHVQNIADRLYQYIPNIFHDHDPFVISYELEKLFAKNPEEFLRLCENRKMNL